LDYKRIGEVKKSVAKEKDERGKRMQGGGRTSDRQEETVGSKVQGQPGGIERKDRCGYSSKRGSGGSGGGG